MSSAMAKLNFAGLTAPPKLTRQSSSMAPPGPRKQQETFSDAMSESTASLKEREPEDSKGEPEASSSVSSEQHLVVPPARDEQHLVVPPARPEQQQQQQMRQQQQQQIQQQNRQQQQQQIQQQNLQQRTSPPAQAEPTAGSAFQAFMQSEIMGKSTALGTLNSQMTTLSQEINERQAAVQELRAKSIHTQGAIAMLHSMSAKFQEMKI